MKTRAYLVLMSLALLFDGRAETLTFDFKDSKGVNNVVFELDAPLEPMGFQEITADAKVTYMPGKLRDFSKGKLQGDLLVIRSEFEIKRSDFGIRPGEFLDKVSNEIDLSLSIAGAAAKGH
jgi:hypothetical protein